MSKTRVAVTGAAGQIGSVLVKRMLENPDIEPVAVCRNRMSAGFLHFYAPGAEVRIGSITEAVSVNKVLGDCDAVINCALASVKGSPKQSRLLNEAIIDGLTGLQKLKLVIHLSSISVYGACIDSKEIHKNTFARPQTDSDYGRSKLHVEQYAKEKFTEKGLNHYVLRLGHVYGAKMDRSKQIVELAQDPKFNLPFNGNIPSNTIHVERLAAMIICLISGPVPYGIYNVAEENNSWRRIFDWHCQAAGLPLVEGMPEGASKELKAQSRSKSIMKDVISWLRSLPVLSLIRYPAIFDFAFKLLGVLPPFIISRLATTYKRLDVKRQMAAVTRDRKTIVAPVYFSDAMPGPHLSVPSELLSGCPSSEELSRQLRDWCRRFANPRWLPDSIRGN